MSEDMMPEFEHHGGAWLPGLALASSTDVPMPSNDIQLPEVMPITTVMQRLRATEAPREG